MCNMLCNCAICRTIDIYDLSSINWIILEPDRYIRWQMLIIDHIGISIYGVLYVLIWKVIFPAPAFHTVYICHNCLMNASKKIIAKMWVHWPIYWFGNILLNHIVFFSLKIMICAYLSKTLTKVIGCSWKSKFRFDSQILPCHQLWRT